LSVLILDTSEYQQRIEKNMRIDSKEEIKCPVNVKNIYYLTRCNTQKYKVKTTNCSIKIKTDFS